MVGIVASPLDFNLNKLMTMIVQYPTKKAFKEAVAADPSAVGLEDPAMMTERLQYNCRRFPITLMKHGDSITVTNHPKRSWFAAVLRNADGSFRVS